MIAREIAPILQNLAQQFSAVAVVGPRQSGKSTLVKALFPDYAYVTLEDLDKRVAAKSDPRGFLTVYSDRKGLIIDEVQEVPELLSYMQGIIDQAYRPGFFILTGSQQLLLNEKITQSLAGRITFLTLLPLSAAELRAAGKLPENVEKLLVSGCYPQLYAHPIDPLTWAPSYITSYIERDIRQILKVKDIIVFQKFLKLCAARIGNLINYLELARDCEISPHTAKHWMSILDATYIVKLLPPYYNNFSKRVIKSPKLYFYDTSLVCSLLGIRTAEELAFHPIKGAIFESFIMSEMFKYNFNHNRPQNLYFWRDTQGREIDCIIERMLGKTVAVEIKAGKTVQDTFFRGLSDWQSITKQAEQPSYVVHGGNEDVSYKSRYVFAWYNVEALMQKIYQS